MKIKDLPETEKPYEKIENYGAKYLSNAELLAVIIKTGTKEKSAVDIAKEVLLLDEEKQGLAFLANASLEDLQNIKGLGRVKAIQLKALAEFAIRFGKPQTLVRQVINSPEDAVKILMSEMQNETQEVVKTLILNNQNELVRVVVNALGTGNSAYVEAKDIYREAIKSNASRIIVAHNHPSRERYSQ